MIIEAALIMMECKKGDPTTECWERIWLLTDLNDNKSSVQGLKTE